MDKKVRLAKKHFITTEEPARYIFDYTQQKFRYCSHSYHNSIREDYIRKLNHLRDDLVAAKCEAHHKQIEVEEAKKHLSDCYVNHKKAPDNSTLEKLRLATNSYHIIRDAWKAQATEVIQIRNHIKEVERKLNSICEVVPEDVLDKCLTRPWKTKKAGILSDRKIQQRWNAIIAGVKEAQHNTRSFHNGFVRITGESFNTRKLPVIAETADHNFIFYYVDKQTREMMPVNIKTYKSLGKAVNGMLISLTQEEGFSVEDIGRNFGFKVEYKYF